MSIVKALLFTLAVGAFGYFSTQTPLIDSLFMIFLAAVFVASAIYFLAKDTK